MNVQIDRINWFPPDKGQHVRYIEHSPRVDECDHSVCNCTKNVKERPEGEPISINQHILFKTDGCELLLYSGTFWFTFRWPTPQGVTWIHEEEKRPHAYFMFNKNHVRSEITVPGYGRVDHFFGDIFFGNNVDISTLMNGHAPSNIVQLDKIQTDQVWAHNCHWGDEYMEFLNENSETSGWRQMIKDAEEVKKKTDWFLVDTIPSVDELRSKVELDTELLQLVSKMHDWLKDMILKNLQSTELYRCCDLVEKTSETMHKTRMANTP